ncbi:hypothetical protein AB0J21_21390 [Streptomyces sp. NPDC049954]|uniref:hypothetical protein n=1 Tax=Streptomyces sp. NPDC049954 TaxID=3155779 RepID=UPI00342D5438
MSRAVQHLETIESLCALPFPREPGRTPHLASGPGHHLAVLLTGGAGPGADEEQREVIEDQFESERDGLVALLEARGWAQPQRFALWSLAVRAAEEPGAVPTPWAELAAAVPDLCLWRRAERWAGLGIARTGPELPVRLLAFVTDVDPP